MTEEDWQRVLREKGYRLTPQRELVLHAVDSLGHATPEEVLAKVREQSAAINISTVYRSLELLEELGLVRHTHITDRTPTYSLAVAVRTTASVLSSSFAPSTWPR